MTALIVVVCAALLALVIANLRMSRVVLCDEDETLRKRLCKVLVIWLFPGIGLALTRAMYRDQVPARSGTYPQEPGQGIDPNVGLRNSAHDYFSDDPTSS